MAYIGSSIRSKRKEALKFFGLQCQPFGILSAWHENTAMLRRASAESSFTPFSHTGGALLDWIYIPFLFVIWILMETKECIYICEASALLWWLKVDLRLHTARSFLSFLLVAGVYHTIIGCGFVGIGFCKPSILSSAPHTDTQTFRYFGPRQAR